MCNPRRIRVRATRRLSEAWDEEVRRQVSLSSAASGEARVRERLGRSVGGPTLAALTRVLERTQGWQEGDDGIFTYQLDGGIVAFDPQSRELEIAARVEVRVEASGEAAAVSRAQVDAVLHASGEGVYDEWGGLTREDARRVAERNADSALTRISDEARARERKRIERASRPGLDEEARRRAKENLAQAVELRKTELAVEARDLLSAIGASGRAVFHRALAEAYRDAILAYARSRHAVGLSWSEQDDGALSIEFEMEV